MKENGWYAWVEGNVELGSDDCSAGNNSVYSCYEKTMWISPSTQRQYCLIKESKGESNAVSLLEQIVANSWADLPTLIEGAYNCTASVSRTPHLPHSILIEPRFVGELS